MEIIKLVLGFMSESPILTFFLAPLVFAFAVFIVVAICATIVDTASAIASIFKSDTKEKSK